jgi:hypothetical protein
LLGWGDAFVEGAEAVLKPKGVKFRLAAWSRASARLGCVECGQEMARVSGEFPLNSGETTLLMAATGQISIQNVLSAFGIDNVTPGRHEVTFT